MSFPTDSNAGGQEFRSARDDHGEYVPESEKNGTAASTYGLSMWFNHWQFAENWIFKRAGRSHGTIKLYSICKLFVWDSAQQRQINAFFSNHEIILSWLFVCHFESFFLIYCSLSRKDVLSNEVISNHVFQTIHCTNSKSESPGMETERKKSWIKTIT